MMYSIEIFGAFDFLPKEVLIGTLEYERVKGNLSYRFQYDGSFLENFSAISLSADLGKFLGLQAGNGGIFSFLSDALPDRWGRALIDKRERIEAELSNRIPRPFDDFGYLVKIDDFSRMGALRFKNKDSYLGVHPGSDSVPPITTLDSFIREAQQIEDAEAKGLPYNKSWIDNVWLPGSSLGGARPKLNVIDDNGNLFIAKIPSVKDTYDVALWEHFACKLAKRAGITVADSSILRVGPTPYHTLLSRRFDRKDGKRIHFASSLTMIGFKDGDNATDGKGYIDIIDAMAGDIGVYALENNAAELFRRAAFNIFIGNHDDHFRNHGFLLREKGWKLSPAYDINPSLYQTQVLAITPTTNNSSIKELFGAAEYYFLSSKDAEEIIREVLSGVEEWTQIAKNLQISETEQGRFSIRFQWAIKQAQALFPRKTKIVMRNISAKGKKNGHHW